MKKLLLPVAVVATLGFASCGGGDLDLCGCMDLKNKYDSEKEAVEALGEEQVEKCMDLMKDAKKEDAEKCK